MIVKEFFARLGMQVNTASFTRANAALNGVSRGMNGMAASAASLTSVVTKLAFVTAAAGAALFGMAYQQAKNAQDIINTAQALGLTTKALQELDYSSKVVGVNVETLHMGIRNLARTMFAAHKGTKDQAKAFHDLGVKVTDAHGKLRNADDVLGDLAEAFSKMPDGTDKTAAALHVFGRAGQQMVPFLNRGRDGIASLRAEAEQLGVVLDDVALKQAKGLKESLTRLGGALTGIKNEVLTTLIPVINDLALSFISWVRANRELIRQRIEQVISGISTAVRVLWAVLTPLFTVLGFVIDHFRILAAILGGVLLASFIGSTAALWEFFGVMSVLIPALGVMAAEAIAAAAAFLVMEWPLVLIGTLFAALVYYIDDVKQAFVDLWDTAGQILKDIGSGLKQIVTLGGLLDFGGGSKNVDDMINGAHPLQAYPSEPAPAPRTRAQSTHNGDGFNPYGDMPFIFDTARATAPLPVTMKQEAAPAPIHTVMNPTFYITTKPGQDNKEIAESVKVEFDSWYDKKMQEAHGAVK